MEPIKDLYAFFRRWPKVTTDSRKDVHNSIFFALSGEQFNGNLFAKQALKKGAALAVVDDPIYAINENYFLVENVLVALQELAHYHRRQFSIPVLGITGSNGKTTTKELIRAVLQTEKRIISTRGNLNNHIGVPLSLLDITSETEIAIIEMGANHKYEIAKLCQIADPNLGLITNIGKAHLEGFGGFEGVVSAKNELYQYIGAKGKTVLVHSDDALLMRLSSGINRFTYGEENAEVSASLCSTKPSLKFEWCHLGKKYVCNSQLYGQYNFPNIIAAVAMGIHFGIKAENINSALEDYQSDNNRSQQIISASNHIILDAYNANPVSMAEAIRSFKDSQFAKPILILGDMFELGEASDEEHQMIIKLCRELDFKEVILVGSAFEKQQNTSYKSFSRTDDLIHFLRTNDISNSQILIKGSRGMQLEKALKHL